ncbi:hypothetical protein Q6348_06325 [Isoptericola sp. b441]|uniref:Uncharacterized protein n=1 Tax=Actinotalea lenta TaxID=3064654 RepID=A0ABT9DBX7_9CELL|nr:MULTISPECIES: hypothetical protein [unclassified Isoptericola]MDO8106811.1 hypothetical protein [Isoptericola sp. b441]MDO8121478.1 hypothetical protein [Isoptericola sp. b490]
MSGAQVDRYALLLAVVAVLAVLVPAFRSRPRFAVVAWTLVVAFVPYWMGVDVKVYVAPATGVALMGIVALTGRRPVRLRAPDLIVAVAVTTAVLAYVGGYGTIHSASVAVLDWGACYVFARLVASSVEARWIYGVVALVLGAAGLLALVEFATGVNVFVHLPALSDYSGSIWRTLQTRGGVLRAEGAFGHSIALGASLAMAVPLALGSRLPKAVKVAVVTTLLAGSVVTFSRIGIGTAVAGLVLSVLLMRSELAMRTRLAMSALFGVVAVVATPLLEGVFAAAGSEAAGSAAYRPALLRLLPTIRVLGMSGARERSAAGTTSFGAFGSIDSAVILAGVTYGLIVVVLLLGLHVTAAATLLRRTEPSPAQIAIVAQLPAVLTVALITQYAMFFWFMAGLAVSTYVRARPSPPYRDVVVSPGRSTRIQRPRSAVLDDDRELSGSEAT